MQRKLLFVHGSAEMQPFRSQDSKGPRSCLRTVLNLGPGKVSFCFKFLHRRFEFCPFHSSAWRWHDNASARVTSSILSFSTNRSCAARQTSQAHITTNTPATTAQGPLNPQGVLRKEFASREYELPWHETVPSSENLVAPRVRRSRTRWSCHRHSPRSWEGCSQRITC